MNFAPKLEQNKILKSETIQQDGNSVAGFMFPSVLLSSKDLIEYPPKQTGIFLSNLMTLDSTLRPKNFQTNYGGQEIFFLSLLILNIPGAIFYENPAGRRKCALNIHI